MLKLLHIFNIGTSSYSYPETINTSYDRLALDLPHKIKFRGKAWEWAAYSRVDDKEHEVELYYSPIVDAETGLKVLGPHAPLTIACQCGAERLGHPGHSGWCDKPKKDGWDEAIAIYIEEEKKAVAEDNQIALDWSYSFY